MSYEEIAEMVEEFGLPCAYDHFASGESPDPPFVCFLFPESRNFGADDCVYHAGSVLHIELYTDAKDPELEGKVEAGLDSHDMYYEKSEVWIESEKMYEVLYTLAV